MFIKSIFYFTISYSGIVEQNLYLRFFHLLGHAWNIYLCFDTSQKRKKKKHRLLKYTGMWMQRILISGESNTTIVSQRDMHKIYLDTYSNRAPKSARGGRLFGVGLNQMSAKQETSVCIPSGSFCFNLLFVEALKLGGIYHMIIVFIWIHSFSTFRRDVNQVYIRFETRLVDLFV